METLTNSKPIEEIVELLPSIKNKIEKTTNEMKEYLFCLKDEKFEEKKNETVENAIKSAESIYDRLDEMVERRKLVMKNGKETIELIDNVKLKIKRVVESCGKDEIHFEKANDELIDIIIDLEDRKRIKDIKLFQDKIDVINNKFRIKKIEWESNLIRKKREVEELRKQEEERKRKEKEIRKQEEEKLKTVIDINEMKQIEQWTGMKIGSIIFDSNIDNWDMGTSVFYGRIINKSNLIFLIEEGYGNKFGGYINAKIDKYYPRDHDAKIYDSKSFVFSLKSNRRLNGMMKFNIKQSRSHDAFYLCNQSSGYNQTESQCLFSIGGDISIYKKIYNYYSSCFQSNFDYNGIQNALCGKREFTPKRITVIQLI